MVLKIGQMKAFSEAAKPLMEYLKMNHHPYVTAIIQENSAELLESSCRING